ncbi:serine/threonine protein kinase, partial [Actinomyces slackii]
RDPGRPQGVPDALWEVVAAMLAKHPSARPPLEAVIHRLDALQTELAGLPAAPVLAAPPESAISQAPYDWDQPAPGGAPAPAGPASAPSSPVGTAPGTPSGPWAATVAGTTAPTLSAQLSGLPAATPPTAIGDGAMPGGPLPPPTQGPLAISSGMAPGSPAPAAAAAPGGRRRRRRLWIPALAVVLVIALAAGGFLLWRHYRDQGSVQAGWLISLPEASRAREDMRVSKISELRISPDGSMLAGESGSTWSLYDLSAAATDSVWSGECSEAAFWSSEALLCTQSGDKRVLVSRDGSTSAVPGPSESTLIGAAEERTILVDADVFDGDLIALDAEGKEAWRAYGKYSEGIVRNGFVLTYESESHAIQVLSAQTGAVLTSVRDEEPDFSDDGAGSPPGGFDLTLSTQAFARLTKDGATIYDAEGTTTQTITGDFSGTVNVATSTPLSPEALAEAYRASSARPSSHYAVGPNGVEEVAVDIHACTATAKGKALEIPKRSEGQTCLIKPLGIIGGDILVAQVGEPSDAQTESVLGLSLDDGSVVWKAAGTYRGVAPTEEGGRLIVSHGANPSDIAVVSLSEK